MVSGLFLKYRHNLSYLVSQSRARKANTIDEVFRVEVANYANVEMGALGIDRLFWTEFSIEYSHEWKDRSWYFSVGVAN